MTLLFLMLTIVFGVAGVAAVIVLRGKKGALGPCSRPPTDPYQIAYLNNGPDGAIRIALYSLVQAGLLTAVAGRVKVAKPGAAQLCENDLERTIINMVGEGLAVSTVVSDPAIVRGTQSFRAALISEHLLADDELRASNRTLTLMVGGVVAAFALLFFIIQVARGADDAGILLGALLAVIVVFGGLAAVLPRLTPRGSHALTGLRQRFQQTAANKSSQGGPESLVIAGLFGFTALPTAEQPLARVIFFKGK